MNLHEIEQTLRTLQSRHPGLNEALLVTLLRGGGWEEKTIQDAIVLFRSGSVMPKKEEPQSTPVAKVLPAFPEEPVLTPQVDENHLLLAHNEEVPKEAIVPPSVEREPQSLIETPSEPVRRKKDELPHNLPLRPFETSDHVWPFSRYRDVFFGEAEHEPVKEERSIEAPAQKIPAQEQAQPEIKPETKIEQTIITPPIIVEAKKQDIVRSDIPPVVIPPEPAKLKEIAPAPLTRGDEKLVITATVMLVAILLLLGYMYSNGRL